MNTRKKKATNVVSLAEYRKRHAVLFLSEERAVRRWLLQASRSPRRR